MCGIMIMGTVVDECKRAGHNGTINGQGQSWWKKHQRRLLNNTRGPLVQIMWSSDIVVANVTLRDSPFWTLHPYDCKNVTIRNVTILAPVTGAPNTDGIDPGMFIHLLVSLLRLNLNPFEPFFFP